MIMKKCS